MFKYKRYLFTFLAIAIICLFFFFKHTSTVYTFSRIQKILARQNLFLLQPAGQKEIFQGRWLNQYEFAVDAEIPYPSLIIWLDDFDNFVGISAFWDGNRWGSPADIKAARPLDGLNYYFCNIAVCNGFEQLTGIDLSRIIGGNKSIEKNGIDVFETKHNPWRIIISRYKASVFAEASEGYKGICNLNHLTYDSNSTDIDYSIYPFSAFGVSW